MNEELSIYSLEEFVSHGGEPQHYLGRAYYCWQDIPFVNDYEGREPDTVRRVLFRCGDHPRVLSKKLRIKEWKERVAAMQREIQAMEVSIVRFEKELSNDI
jgi:hypothetical protein